jgi:hypothetical protein
MHDPVNHPEHYASGGIECIEAIEASMSEEALLGYLKGNCIKYLWRYEQKGGSESLRKCQWYLNRLISHVQCQEAATAAAQEVADVLAMPQCTDGFCSMPNVRSGPPETAFSAMFATESSPMFDPVSQ